MENCKRDPMRVDIVFKSEDFKDKKNIFILAKTWGAANLFMNKTKLSQFRNVKIEYLSSEKQLIVLIKKETIIIELTRALETKHNAKLLRLAESKNIKIVKFPALSD